MRTALWRRVLASSFISVILVACASTASAGDAVSDIAPPSTPAATTEFFGARRVAVVVGADAAIEGRSPLRYARSDARAMAEVLIDLGHFSRGDVHVLFDPEPDVIESALEAELRAAASRPEPTLLVFYYSGHADQGALHPGGRRLDLRNLRAKLEDPRAAVRLGILDACQGGSWTTAKGLVPGAPFEVPLPLALENEGSILIASSSGQESAHEVDALAGSLFTHHLIAGLRGAADASADGAVTLEEAFDYARELTARDAALFSRVPQHPSFNLRLKGRKELTLTQLGSAPNVLELAQQDGPLEVVHLGLGLKLVELRPGRRRVRLALPPGRYMIQRRVKEGAWAREFELVGGQVVELAEEDLELRGLAVLVAKGSEPTPATHRTSLPRGTSVFRIAAGFAHGPGPLSGLSSVDEDTVRRSFLLTSSGTFGLTDRLQVVLPLLLAFRFGEQGGFETTPWGGLAGAAVGYLSADGLHLGARLALGMDGRVWIGDRASFGLSGLASSSGSWTSRGPRRGFQQWTSSLRLGYSQRLTGNVVFNLGVGVVAEALDHGRFFGDAQPQLVFGSAAVRGGQELPLLQIHVTDTVSIDGWAKFLIGRDGVQDSYLIGTSIQF